MANRTVVILDGGTAASASLTDPAAAVTVKLLDRLGWGSSLFRMRELDIAPCRGCFDCWVKTPGVCIIDDPARDIAREFMRSDLVVFLTPITFGGYSSELKKGIDRLIPLILPYFTFVGSEIHHIRRYRSYPNLLGIGTLPGPDPEGEAIFSDLLVRNSINIYALDVDTCVVYEGDHNPEEKIEEKLLGVIDR